MSGQQLYARYAKVQWQLCTCLVDEWDDLDPDERLVWDALAGGL